MTSKRESPDKATTSACVNDGSSPLGAEFEVFLSFRGPDTRLSFTDCLYHSLVRAGIRIFRDDEEIRKGEKIAGELLRAIESSKVYMPIFSRNYASSVWCLRELRHMVESLSKANDKVILPIFYDVNSYDVKLKTQLYLHALQKHEKKFSRNDVQQWKEALTEVARIKGWGVKDRGHGEIINAVVDEVFTKLNKRRRNLPDHLVGIHDHVEAIMDLLNKGSRNVSYAVIHGMGGISKTTLASVVFNQISAEFQGCSFLLDVRESVRRGRIIDLQIQLLSEILQRKDLAIHDSVDAGINILRERFHDKKVLLVLDDVDKWSQLSKLAGKSDWFGLGSKIILTTRDINFLPIKEEGEESHFQVHYEDFEFYKMTEMDSSCALQLFSKHAFGMDSPPHDYDDISRNITQKTGGLPLALKVIGSSLFRRSKNIWKATLKKLNLVPKQEVFDKLKISYDMLEPPQREIFLDIACYFIGIERLHPYYMWKASNYFPKIEILVLARMSLIKIETMDTLWMHDQLRDIGREIIQREDINAPGRRSRLWEPEIAQNVVRWKEGTDKIVALRLTRLSKVQYFTSEEFSKLPNLRFLELEHGKLVGDFKNLLSRLTWLSWKYFPSKLDVTNLCLDKLVVLQLSHSDITEDWAGLGPCLVSENLKFIDITFCRLKRTPDTSKCKNLRRLVLRGCTTLPVVDGALSLQEHLKHLAITGMIPRDSYIDPFAVPSALGGLRSQSMLEAVNMGVGGLHPSFREMTQLKCMCLSNGLLRIIVDSVGKLESLDELDLGRRRIRSLSQLKHLKHLAIKWMIQWDSYSNLFAVRSALDGLRSLSTLEVENMCVGLLHQSIGEMTHLKYLCLFNCFLGTLPDSIGKLESLLELDLGRTGITELPHSIGDLKMLTKMSLYATPTKKLPNSIGGLESLIELDLMSTHITELPSCIGNLKRLEILRLCHSAIREIPNAIAMLENLTKLEALECINLDGEIPSEIGSLRLLRTLKLSWSKIRRLPTTMNQLSHLQDLRLCGCDKLEQLPELPMSLKELDFSSHLLWTSLNLSNLTNLIKLRINKSTSRLSEFGEGAPNIEWIKGLSNLESLCLCVEDVMFSPIDLATLSRLRVLEINCADPQSPIKLPSSLKELTLYDLKSPVLSLLFSNLTNLSYLSPCTSWLREVEFDDVLGQQLEKLSTLEVKQSELLERLSVSGLSRLKGLKSLKVFYCPRLMEIQGVEKLESLETLVIFRCESLKELPGLSEAKKLRNLNSTIVHC